MATKSAKKKAVAKPKTKAKAKAKPKKTIKKNAVKKVAPLKKVAKKTATPKPVAIKKTAKKAVIKKSVIAKKTVTKVVKKASVAPKKTTKKIIPKKPTVTQPKATPATPAVKKKITPKAIVKKPEIKKAIVKTVEAKKVAPAKVVAKKPAPKISKPNRTNLFPKKPTNDYYGEHLKFWFILFFVVLVVLLFSKYSGGFISKTYADLHSEVVQNPIVCPIGNYYKYEAHSNDWEYFNGDAIVKDLHQAGVYFDEAWYQEGGNMCDTCNASAAPLLYVKNPNQALTEPWVKVSQPGFYGNNQFAIHHYY